MAGSGQSSASGLTAYLTNPSVKPSSRLPVPPAKIWCKMCVTRRSESGNPVCMPPSSTVSRQSQAAHRLSRDGTGHVGQATHWDKNSGQGTNPCHRMAAGPTLTHRPLLQDDIRTSYERFTEDTIAADVAVYAGVSDAVARSPQLLGLLATLDPIQQAPSYLISALWELGACLQEPEASVRFACSNWLPVVSQMRRYTSIG